MKCKFNRKLLAILLSVTLMLNSGMTAFAADEGTSGAGSTTPSTQSEETPPSKDGIQVGLSDPSGSDNVPTGDVNELDCTCTPVEGSEVTHVEGCTLYVPPVVEPPVVEPPVVEPPTVPEQTEAVKNVLALISALPTMAELEAQNPESAEFTDYLEKLHLDVAAARAAYDALTDEEKATFDATALAKLTELEGILALIAVPMNLGANAITITINGGAEFGGANLKAAVDAARGSNTYFTITTLTITGGKVTAADWEWFKGGDIPVLTALTDFTISADVASVANIPAGTSDPGGSYPIFPKSIKTVTIPKATTIGRSAFDKCELLVTADFPAATDIGANAFRSCTKLETADFPAATSIGNSAFFLCAALKSVSFPAATTIGAHAFNNCRALENVSFPAATTIGNNAFESCTALEGVSLPLMTSIGTYAFNGCTKLATLKLGKSPPTVTNVNAFKNCPTTRALGLVKADGTALTGNDFTAAKTAYDAITDGITDSTDSDLLWFGWTLTELKPIEIEVNGTTTAYGGADLQAAIDAALVGIGGSATYANITTLTITGGEVTTADWAWFKGGNTNVPVLSGLTDFTIDTAVGKVANIPDGANAKPIFPKTIVNVTIPKVTTIGNDAFSGCTALETASFPLATSIGDGAFENCTALATANFPLATAIGSCAFILTALESASFPLATSIGEYAFWDCTVLETITFPAATSIGEYAFTDCIALKSVSFPAATSIGVGAFSGCTVLTTLKLGATPPTSVGTDAFYDCPTSRALVSVKADGTTELTGTEFTTAAALYDAIADGITGSTAIDGLWYGWKVREAVTLASIAVTTSPSKLAYTVGETFDKAGMVVTATYSNNSTAPVTSYTTSPTIALTISDIKITVSYTEGSVTETADVSITVNAVPALTGTVAITGTLKFGEPLTATVSGDTNNTGTLSYQWKRDGSNIATGSTYTTVAADIEQTLTCVVTSTVQTGDISSTATAAIAKADGSAAPTAPNIIYANETVATLATWEYKVGSTWADCTADMVATDFGWDGNTDKTVEFRTAANATHEAGAEVSLIIPARPNAPLANAFTITKPTAGGADGKLNGITSDMEYHTGNGTYTGGGAELTGITDGTAYTIRNKAAASAFASNTVTVTVASKTSVAVTFADNTVSYNGTVQAHEAAITTATGGTMTYSYATTDGTLDGGKPKGAGTYTVTAAYESVTEIGTATATLTINKLPLTIKAEDKTMYYSHDLPALTVKYTGFITGEDENNALTGTAYTAATAADGKTVGTYDITISGSATAKNYTITTPKGTLTVLEKILTGATDTMPTAPTTETVAIPTTSLPTGTNLSDLQLSVSYTVTTDDTTALDSATASETGFANKQNLEISLIDMTTKLPVQPGGEITIFIPYPTGTNKNDTFTLIHILTGGGTDKITPTKLDNGLQFNVSSLSPFAIGWTKYVAPSSGGGDGADTDEYEFWMTVKGKVDSANSGDVIKVSAKHYDNMPASVISALYNDGVGMVITWDGGKTVTIPAGKAHPHEAGRIYYPLSLLAELYKGIAFVTSANPETGGYIAYADGKQVPIVGGIIELAPPVIANAPDTATPITPPTALAPPTASLADTTQASSNRWAAIALMLVAAAVGSGVWLWRNKQKVQ